MTDAPQATPATGPPSRKRKLILWMLLILITYGLIELCSFAAFWVIRRYPVSFASLQDERSAVMPDTIVARNRQLPKHFRTEVLHPYVGYVKNPEFVEEANRFGFLTVEEFPSGRSEDTVLIGITGGSVALNFAREGSQVLIDELKAAPRFRTKELRIVNLALDGFKQPQQLMALSYFLALGGELDLLVNIDGFNDVALYAGEDPEWLVSSFYPREWRMRVANAPDPVLLMHQGSIVKLRIELERWAAWFSRAPQRHSMTANLIWKIRHFLLAGKISGHYEFLRQYRPAGLSYEATGPPPEFETEEEMYAHLAELWKRCSLLMDGLCRGQGIAYHHFLQPNQYVAGSKQMGAHERPGLPRDPSLPAGGGDGLPGAAGAGSRSGRAGCPLP